MRKASYRLRMPGNIRSKCFVSITRLPTTTTVPKRFPVVRLLPASFETNSRTVLNTEDVCHTLYRKIESALFLLGITVVIRTRQKPFQIWLSDSGIAAAKTFAYEFVDKFLPSRQKCLCVLKLHCFFSIASSRQSISAAHFERTNPHFSGGGVVESTTYLSYYGPTFRCTLQLVWRTVFFSKPAVSVGIIEKLKFSKEDCEETVCQT